MILKDQHQSNTQPRQTTLEQLLECSSNYPHLQLILSRDGNIRQGTGQQYLMVTPSSFGVVRLNDLDYNDNKILLDLQDVNSGILKRISINVDDNKFRFILISWSDIRRMVQVESKTTIDHDELLEFDF